MNNNSKQSILSIQSRREILGINIRSNTVNSELESRRRVESQRNTVYTQKRAQQHHDRINEVAIQISLLLEYAPFNVNAAFDLLYQLYDFLLMDDTVYVKLDDLTAPLLAFRDIVAGISENQKQVPFLLLCYHADICLSIMTRRHTPKYIPDEILNVLTLKVEPHSRDFIIQNARNSELWAQAVITQGIQLTDEKLMEVMLRMLDQPHTWGVFIAQKKMPFNQQICQYAWQNKKSPEIGSFIIQQVMKGGAYFNAFYTYGIYDAFKVFIVETNQEADLQVKIQRVLTILEGLSSLWADYEIFSNTKLIYESRIFEWIADIPVQQFNKDALFKILGFINRIEHNPKYDLNYISTTFAWYQGLYKILLFQRVNQMILDQAINKIDVLCKGGLIYPSIEKFTVTIQEYELEVEKRNTPQKESHKNVCYFTTRKLGNF
ncbi:hypothetical protein pb186bvf_003504 [Paramecium bursaria]